MKRYFLLLTVLSFAFVFEAKEVSYDEALQTASEFFAPASSSKKQIKALKSNLSLATTFNQTINSEKPAFYIINNGENGFVIVSADNNATQILGYSDKGAFDAENIPSNVKFWLDRYAEEISYVAKNNIKQPLYANSVTYDAVAPLLGKIEHTQLKPYNDSCPKIDGKETPTGCVATAGGQIMTYWKHPKQGKGNVSYTTSTHNLPLSADLSKSTYDWANILDKYVRYPKNYNDQQAKAVAVLLRDIGYAVQMNYMTTGSASSDQDMAMAFVNHFGYDKSLHRKSFDYTLEGSSETWYWQSKEDLLYDLCDELKAGRPVYCAGMSPTKNEGHVFVCDGIQSDGKLHINWGWDGDKNGYFEVTSFNPGGGGEGAGDGVYTRGIAFITHIQPDKGTTELSQSWGIKNVHYVPTTNEFSKTDNTEFALMQDVSNTYKYVCNLNFFPATIYFGYSIFKKTDCISATYARWGDFGEDYETYLDGNGMNSEPIPDGRAYKSPSTRYTIDPLIKINNLVKDVAVGAYDLYLSMLSSPTSKIGHPIYIKDRGKVKNKIAIGKTKAYIYPASETNYSRSNNPSALKATQNGEKYTLSWSGNASNYLLLIWDEEDLTVEKVSGKSKADVSEGKSWAVVAYEQVGSVVYATSDMVYGKKVGDNTPDDPTANEVVNDENLTIAINQLTIEVKSDMQNSIKIYTISGEVLYSVHDSYASFKAPQAGVYIVQVGDKKQKVLVQ